MADPTFIMVPFLAGGGEELHPGSPLRFGIEAYARAVADSAAPLYAGVAVLEEPADAFAEPRLVEARGRVPPSIAGLAA